MKFMNLLNITWATGAMPMGAPGWPLLALKVASTCMEKGLLALASSLNQFVFRKWGAMEARAQSQNFVESMVGFNSRPTDELC